MRKGEKGRCRVREKSKVGGRVILGNFHNFISVHLSLSHGAEARTGNGVCWRVLVCVGVCWCVLVYV